MCSGFPHPAAPGRWVHARRDRAARAAGGTAPAAGVRAPATTRYRHSILSTELLEPMNYRREGIPKEACSGRAPGEGALTRILGADVLPARPSVSERGRAPRTARVASGAPDLRLLGAVVKIETVQHADLGLGRIITSQSCSATVEQGGRDKSQEEPRIGRNWHRFRKSARCPS